MGRNPEERNEDKLLHSHYSTSENLEDWISSPTVLSVFTPRKWCHCSLDLAVMSRKHYVHISGYCRDECNYDNYTTSTTSVTVMNTATQLITIIPSCVTITHAEGKRDSHGDEDQGGDQHHLCLRWTTAACWKR